MHKFGSNSYKTISAAISDYDRNGINTDQIVSVGYMKVKISRSPDGISHEILDLNKPEKFSISDFSYFINVNKV